ncbi:hypothetical protein ACC772_38865, partial [Rhizobium ruizarguesonis]
KRIAELEAGFASPLFDRTLRQSVLTPQGNDVRDIAEQILRLHDRLKLTARSISTPLKFRLGVSTDCRSVRSKSGEANPASSSAM